MRFRHKCTVASTFPAAFSAMLVTAVHRAPALAYRPTEVSTSAELPPKYAAAKAVDGDPETRWAAPDVPPQWLKVTLSETVPVDAVRIVGVGQQKIYDNWRRVTFSFSNGSVFSVTLADDWKEHTIRFPERKVRWVKVIIESTYKHTHYVGCSEFRVLYERHGKKTISVTPPSPPPAAGTSVSDPGARNETDEDIFRRLAHAPAVGRGHPNLWLTPKDVEHARQNIRKHQWARDWFRSVLHIADAWAARSPQEIRRLMPPPKAVFDRRVSCPVCGANLQANLSRPHKVWCPKCRREFPNADYPDDGGGWKDPGTGKVHYFVGLYNDAAITQFDRALRALADAYVLTGEEPFARAASVILDGLATIYPTCTTGPKWYPGVGGRLNRPFYQAARTLIWYADEYDLTWNSPEWDRPSANPGFPTRRRNVEENLFRNGGEYCFSEIQRYGGVKSLNNGFCDYLQGALAVGRLLGVRRYLDYELKSELSIFYFFDNTIDRDGQYFETAPLYSSWALDLFTHHAEMLLNLRSAAFPQGVDLYAHPKLRLALERSERDIDCAGRIPPIGDTGPDLRVIPPEKQTGCNDLALSRLEYLAVRLRAPAARARCRKLLPACTGGELDKARALSRIRRWLVFHAWTPAQGESDGLPAEASDWSDRVTNTLLPAGRGFGILRLGDRVSGVTAGLLRWGPTLNHGTPDELNVNLFALGREVTYDPGYGWAHYRSGWSHVTGSHNLVVVNEKNQLQKPGSGGNLELWFEAPGIAAVAADDPMAYGSENVSIYRRTLVPADTGSGGRYLLDVFRVAGGRTHDLNWHFQGDLHEISGVDLSPPETSGSLAGPDFEWWKLLERNGWLRGFESKGFYWRPPPGNGYGFIHHLQRGRPSEACRFDWKLGMRTPRPRWIFSPSESVAETSGRLHKPLSLGAYFYRGERPGDFIEFEFSVEAPGRRVLLAVFYKSSHYGIVQAALDGRPLAPPIDTYSPTGYFTDPIVLGETHLTAGPHRLRFTVVGKTPESEGLFFSIQYFAIDTPDFVERLQHPQPERVRLHLLPPQDARIFVGRGVAMSHWPTPTYVITRRQVASDSTLDTQFVSLVEPAAGPFSVAGIERAAMPSIRARGARDVAAICVRLDADGADYLFESVDPSPPAAYTFSNGEQIRFGGRFGVIRFRKGKPVLLGLYGNGEIAAGDARLVVRDAEFHGRVTGVDPANGWVLTDAHLPEGKTLAGCVIQFSNPAYSRRSAFQIRNTAQVQGQTRIDLECASLVMARGLVGDAKAPPGVIPNMTPLDRERMVHRAFRTLYFQGRRLKSETGEDWGRVQDIDLRNWHVQSTRAVAPRPGQRFRIIELGAGDRFFIIRPTVRILDRRG